MIIGLHNVCHIRRFISLDGIDDGIQIGASLRSLVQQGIRGPFNDRVGMIFPIPLPSEAIRRTTRTPALPGFLFSGRFGLVRGASGESDGTGDGMPCGGVDKACSIPSGVARQVMGLESCGASVGAAFQRFDGIGSAEARDGIRGGGGDGIELVGSAEIQCWRGIWRK